MKPVGEVTFTDLEVQETGSRQHCTLKSKLILTKIYILVAQFVLKRDKFALVFHT